MDGDTVTEEIVQERERLSLIKSGGSENVIN